MRTDRELLELAAKAAGVKIEGYMERIDDYYSDWNGAAAFALEDGGYWNPLTDDGDALRLAFKLKLNISFIGTSVHAGWNTRDPSPDGWGNQEDGEAIMRRAIVRAAAAIGEAMP